MLTDKEIVEGLILKDRKVTEQFFFTKCRPLMYSIIFKFFGYEVEYDELINELYAFLMDRDAKVLRSFRFESSLCQWLKRVAYNYFYDWKNREVMIEDHSKEAPLERENGNEDVVDLAGNYCTTVDEVSMDISLLLPRMHNARYRMVLEKLFLEEMDYDELSKITGLTKSNLYNIKKRALYELLQIVSDER